MTKSFSDSEKPKILFVVNEDWAFLRFRKPLAMALAAAGWEVVVCCPPGECRAAIEATGFRVVPIRIRRQSKNPFTEWRCLLDLIHCYRREKPAIAHHFAAKPILYGSVASAVAGVATVVNSVTGVGYAYSSGGCLRWLLRSAFNLGYRWALNRPGAKVVFLNEEDRHLFLSYRLCNPWSSHVIEGEGIDITAFRPSPPPEEVVTVLYGGRMLWDKGVDTLVEASRLLKSRGVRARVILAGVPDKANPSSIPESKLQEWSNGGFVEWVGHQENMVNLVKLAHIACLASRREGVPTFLLEAAACGRPIIATDVPGCRDVVEHGYNGLLFPFGDAERLAACLENLINNPGLRTTLGQNSRQLAMDRFSIEVIAPKYLDIYSAMTRGGLPRQQVSIPPNPAAEAVRKIGSVPVPGPAAGKES